MKRARIQFFSTMTSLLAVLFIFSVNNNLAAANTGTSAVDTCTTIVGSVESVMDCPDQLFGSCVAFYSAQLNSTKKNEAFSEQCPSDLITLATCAGETTDTKGFCKCYVENNPNGCPRGAIGACISDQKAKDNVAKKSARFLELFGQCTFVP